MTNPISVLGDQRIVGSLILDKNNIDFPVNPKIGTIVVKGSDLFAYLNVNGVTDWYSLSQGITEIKTINGQSLLGSGDVTISTPPAVTNLSQGTNTATTVVVDSSNGTSATLSAATDTTAGILSATDKAKLDGIAAGATNFTLPPATATVLGGVKVGNNLSVDANGVLSANVSGSSGPAITFNNVSRYFMDTTAGQMVQCVSSSTVFSNLAWSRNTTSMTFTHPSHGHNVGERVIVKNTNVTEIVALITAVTTDTFTFACADSGAVSGTTGAYSMGLTYAHNAAQGSITGGTLTAPANSDVQLLSIRIHLKASSRSVTTHTIVFPSSVICGLGATNNNDGVYMPVQQVRQDGDPLTAVANTVGMNFGGSYSTFQFAALPAITTGIIIAIQF